MRQETLQRVFPWLVLAIALGVATLPMWRVMLFGPRVTIEDLLTLRC